MSCILLIEDNIGVSQSLQNLLENDNHTVSVCHDTAAAVELIGSDQHFDIAFVDYWLGRETAEQVLTALHDSRPDVHVILITGGSSAVSVEKTKWLGALDGIHGFLQKPFSVRELRAIIDSLK